LIAAPAEETPTTTEEPVIRGRPSIVPNPTVVPNAAADGSGRRRKKAEPEPAIAQAS
jgi:hypothetical protein